MCSMSFASICLIVGGFFSLPCNIDSAKDGKAIHLQNDDFSVDMTGEAQKE